MVEAARGGAPLRVITELPSTPGATVPLALQTSIHAPVADSVVEVIRNGIRPPTGALGRSMPAFGPQMSEADIAALVKFLRDRFSGQAPWKK
jgi:mono/diheme cytochrome c family protein